MGKLIYSAIAFLYGRRMYETMMGWEAVAVGAGTRALPDGLEVQLALTDERRFGNGTVFLRYEVRPNL